MLFSHGSKLAWMNMLNEHLVLQWGPCCKVFQKATKTAETVVSSFDAVTSMQVVIAVRALSDHDAVDLPFVYIKYPYYLHFLWLENRACYVEVMSKSKSLQPFLLHFGHSDTYCMSHNRSSRTGTKNHHQRTGTTASISVSMSSVRGQSHYAKTLKRTLKLLVTSSKVPCY